MERAITTLLRRVPDYHVEKGIMHVTAGDWGFAIPLPEFEIALVRARRAIDEYRGRSAELLPFDKARRRDHAASS